MAKTKRNNLVGLWVSLAVSSTVSLLFLLFRKLESGSGRYLFLVWNLFLAWLPLLFGWLLVKRIREGKSWSSTPNILLAVLWIAFLPNSFYIVSDFIHLHATGEVSLLYDVVMMSSFVFNGFVAGFLSLLMVHNQMIKRIGRAYAHTLIAVILLACSFAIYLGRNLRWNSWDLAVNPTGIIFDVSDRVIAPAAHLQSFVITAIFFALLGSMYLVIWQTVRALRNSR